MEIVMLYLLVCAALAAPPDASVPVDNNPSLGIVCKAVSKVIPLFNQASTPIPPTSDGVIIQKIVKGSPAEIAGLKAVDVLYRLGEVRIKGMDDYKRACKTMTIGESINITYFRLTPDRNKSAWQKYTTKAMPVEYFKMAAAFAEDKAAEAKAGPLKIREASLDRNTINLPTLSVTVYNASDKDVIAFECEMDCFNRFDEKVTDFSGVNVFRGISQISIVARGKQSGSWQLSVQSNTAKGTVRITRVKFADGEVWKTDKDGSPGIKVELKD